MKINLTYLEDAVKSELFQLLQSIEDDMQEQIIAHEAKDGWEKAIRFINMNKNRVFHSSASFDRDLVYKNKDI